MKKMRYVILIKKSKYRRDKDKPAAPNPIRRSRYAQSLWEVGAGWK